MGEKIEDGEYKIIEDKAGSRGYSFPIFKGASDPASARAKYIVENFELNEDMDSVFRTKGDVCILTKRRCSSGACKMCGMMNVYGRIVTKVFDLDVPSEEFGRNAE